MRRSVEIRIRVGDGDRDGVALCLGFPMWRVPADAAISLSSTICSLLSTRCDLSDLSAVLNEILLVFSFILTFLFEFNALFPLFNPLVVLIGLAPFPLSFAGCACAFKFCFASRFRLRIVHLFVALEKGY